MVNKTKTLLLLFALMQTECTEVKRILEDNNISVRSVDENDSSNASVVVDWHTNVLSYEWPTVLAVSLYYPIDYIQDFCRLLLHAPFVNW